MNQLQSINAKIDSLMDNDRRTDKQEHQLRSLCRQRAEVMNAFRL